MAPAWVGVVGVGKGRVSELGRDSLGEGRSWSLGRQGRSRGKDTGRDGAGCKWAWSAEDCELRVLLSPERVERCALVGCRRILISPEVRQGRDLRFVGWASELGLS